MAKAKKQTEQKINTSQEQVSSLRTEIYALSMQKVKGQLKNTTSLRVKKDELARLLTKMTMEHLIVKHEVKEEAK